MVLWWAFAACMALLVGVCLLGTGGALVYSMDDPYIHLALARTIQAGSYGINPGEWASPSSSIVWPFLLAPWPPALFELAPLLINLMCAAGLVWVLRQVLRGPLLSERQQPWVALLVGFGLNLFGLVMLGMEHTLQLLLVCFMAWRLTQARFDAWFYVAMAVAPLVRYELLCITGPVALYLWRAHGERWRPALALLATVAVVGAFSGFLHSKGLPWLPSSVLAKTADHNIRQNFTRNPSFYLLLWWLHHAYARRRTAFWCLAVLPLAGFMLAGRSGWFGRYEAFMATWLAVLALQALQTEPLPTWQAPRWWQPQWLTRSPQRFALVLALAFPALWYYTLVTPLGCMNIARQQVLMAELVRRLGQPVAVNDLGLVALRSGQRVLDLWGLGSPKVLALRLARTQPPEVWMDEITRREQVHYAFVYEKWFPTHPAHWLKVGELRLNVLPVSVPSPTVALFATTPGAVLPLRAVLLQLSADPSRAALIRVLPDSR